MDEDRQQATLDHQLCSAALLGNHSMVASLLSQGADPLADHSMALRFCSMNGYFECVQILLPLSCPGSSSMALRMASFCGREECVKLIVARSSQALDFGGAVESAAAHGHAGCIAILLPLVRNFSSRAVFGAAFGGHAGALSALLDACVDRSDFPELLAEAHAVAIANGRAECAQMLKALMELGELGSSTGIAQNSDPHPPRL